MKTRLTAAVSCSFSHTRGNAFVYILIAVALFAGLSLALSNMAGDENQKRVDASYLQGSVSSMMAYAAAVQNTIEQMELQGVPINSINFILPQEANFNDNGVVVTGAFNRNKLFHPSGGGLSYKPLPTEITGTTATTPAAGYYVDRFNNVEWTPTDAADVGGTFPTLADTEDVLFVAYNITEAACKAINQKIRGNTTIPLLSGTPVNYLITDRLHGGSNSDFTATQCADCENISAMCVRTGAPIYIFYNIIYAR